MEFTVLASASCSRRDTASSGRVAETDEPGVDGGVSASAAFAAAALAACSALAASAVALAAAICARIANDSATGRASGEVFSGRLTMSHRDFC